MDVQLCGTWFDSGAKVLPRDNRPGLARVYREESIAVPDQTEQSLRNGRGLRHQHTDVSVEKRLLGDKGEKLRDHKDNEKRIFSKKGLSKEGSFSLSHFFSSFSEMFIENVFTKFILSG